MRLQLTSQQQAAYDLAYREASCVAEADGFVKVEVGDDVLTLSPMEARRLARGLGGFAEDSRLLDLNRVLAQIAPQFE